MNMNRENSEKVNELEDKVKNFIDNKYTSDNIVYHQNILTSKNLSIIKRSLHLRDIVNPYNINIFNKNETLPSIVGLYDNKKKRLDVYPYANKFSLESIYLLKNFDIDQFNRKKTIVKESKSYFYEYRNALAINKRVNRYDDLIYRENKYAVLAVESILEYMGDDTGFLSYRYALYSPKDTIPFSKAKAKEIMNGRVYTKIKLSSKFMKHLTTINNTREVLKRMIINSIGMNNPMPDWYYTSF
jgi:hypothetical protein